MNTNNLYQIFQNYINRFESINGEVHQEYYKWQVCYEYPKLMKNALEASDDDFADELKK